MYMPERAGVGQYLVSTGHTDTDGAHTQIVFIGVMLKRHSPRVLGMQHCYSLQWTLLLLFCRVSWPWSDSRRVTHRYNDDYNKLLACDGQSVTPFHCATMYMYIQFHFHCRMTLRANLRNGLIRIQCIVTSSFHLAHMLGKGNAIRLCSQKLESVVLLWN